MRKTELEKGIQEIERFPKKTYKALNSTWIGICLLIEKEI